MSLLLWIVLFSLLGGILSVTLASLLLVLPASARRRLLPGLVSFAIGALLAAAFTGLLPRAFELAPTAVHSLGLTLLAGILLFFVLEKMVLWRHSHAGHDFEDAAVHAPHAHREAAAGPLILVGDTIHNLVDGVLIGAAFLTDFHLGVLTSIAVAAHELPQELGDFTILLHAGMRPRLALALSGGGAGLCVLIAGLAALCAGLGGGQLHLRGGGRSHPRAAPPGQPVRQPAPGGPDRAGGGRGARRPPAAPAIIPAVAAACACNRLRHL
jgi:zinc and cadmium transporter